MAVDNFDLAANSGLEEINSILTAEANRIGSDINRRILHTSPWIDLTKQTAFPDGMGAQLTTLVYDRAIATTDAAGTTAGVTWSTLSTLETTANRFNTSVGVGNQPLLDAPEETIGARGRDGSTDVRSYVQFGRQLKKYSLQRGVIESPRISLEDLRYAVHRQEQLRAIMDILTDVTRNAWENRYRDEYEKVCANLTFALAAGSKNVTTIDVSAGTKFEGVQLTSVDTNNDFVSSGVDVDYTPNANISNALMDARYFELIRKGGGSDAYGRENGRPVFAAVMSSEASYQLQTEAGFRDDVRYNNAKVSDLIAPLGIEKSFRGFYHLIDDLAPRFSISSGTITKVEPFSVSGGVATPNPSYDTADYEAIYLLHPRVCESQIPNPFSGASGISFSSVDYRGKFDWKNILSEATNPDGTIGFFRGVLASATKPLQTDLGYVILFKRTSATPAA